MQEISSFWEEKRGTEWPSKIYKHNLTPAPRNQLQSIESMWSVKKTIYLLIKFSNKVNYIFILTYLGPTSLIIIIKQRETLPHLRIIRETLR